MSKAPRSVPSAVVSSGGDDDLPVRGVDQRQVGAETGVVVGTLGQLRQHAGVTGPDSLGLADGRDVLTEGGARRQRLGRPDEIEGATADDEFPARSVNPQRGLVVGVEQAHEDVPIGQAASSGHGERPALGRRIRTAVWQQVDGDLGRLVAGIVEHHIGPPIGVGRTSDMCRGRNEPGWLGAPSGGPGHPASRDEYRITGGVVDDGGLGQEARVLQWWCGPRRAPPSTSSDVTSSKTPPIWRYSNGLRVRLRVPRKVPSAVWRSISTAVFRATRLTNPRLVRNPATSPWESWTSRAS
jgi:hypothetical protein